MKKNIFYILILIILLEFFSPAIMVQAAGEACWHLNGTSWSAEATFIVGSEVMCKTRTGTYGVNLIWAIKPPAALTPTQAPPPTPGQCVNSEGIPNGKNYVDCKTPDKWSSVQASLPNCSSAATNIQNGWGWENGKSCREVSADPICSSAATNIQNGWGWENGKSCKVESTAPTTTQRDMTYTLLAPLPGVGKTFDPTSENNSALGTYLNAMIKIFIGICAVLAVIMIVMGGIEYMTTELISSKEAGKERIRNAIFGLLLALGAWTILNTINPDILKSDLKSLTNVTVEVTLADQIKSYTGQGTCTPVADSSNPCSPDSLSNAGFTDKTQASSICNAESRGNSTLGSGVDKGSDGNSFSFGLFQINIIAHANEIPGGVCSGVFTVNPNDPKAIGTSANDKTLGSCLQKDPSGKICVKYSAVVTNQTKYQSCKDYITNPTNNIKYAAKLQTSRNWNQWGANSSCRF